jgi:hypothetical protein
MKYLAYLNISCLEIITCKTVETAKKGAGLTLEGEEAALWLLTSLCTSAKREVEVAL